MFIEYAGKAPRVSATAFIAPTAVLIGDVEVGPEASIWFGVVLRADTGSIRIGARSSLEDNAVVHAAGARSTVVGADVIVGHGAVLDGCTIEDGALVGSNAVVLDGAVVEHGAVVAAGSVVTGDSRIPACTVVAGAPAEHRKSVSGRAADWIAHAASDSLVQSQAYRRDNLGDPQHHDFKSATSRKRAPATVG
jgi:carbonic anhydrase/acetyltransferase-like protein (isoleucine patch superfamily)